MFCSAINVKKFSERERESERERDKQNKSDFVLSKKQMETCFACLMLAHFTGYSGEGIFFFFLLSFAQFALIANCSEQSLQRCRSAEFKTLHPNGIMG